MSFLSDICRTILQGGIDLLIILVIYNVLVCTIYGLDKRRARSRGERISEQTLKLLTIFFGGLGACVGMIVFHHKTRHKDFRILVSLCLVVQMLLFALVLIFGI